MESIYPPRSSITTQGEKVISRFLHSSAKARKVSFILAPATSLCPCTLLVPRRRTGGPNIGFTTSPNASFHQGVSGTTDDPSTGESGESGMVCVRFETKECQFGEKVFLVGDETTLGLWDPSSAVPLDWSEGHVWSVEQDLPIGRSIQFKFILRDSSGEITWQPGPDRAVLTWETANTIIVSEDWDVPDKQEISACLDTRFAEISKPLSDSGQEQHCSVASQTEDNGMEVDGSTISDESQIEDTEKELSIMSDGQIVNGSVTGQEQSFMVPGLAPAPSSENGALLASAMLDQTDMTLQEERVELNNMYQQEAEVTSPDEASDDGMHDKSTLTCGDQQEKENNEHIGSIATGEDQQEEKCEDNSPAVLNVVKKDIQWGQETFHEFFGDGPRPVYDVVKKDIQWGQETIHEFLGEDPPPVYDVE